MAKLVLLFLACCALRVSVAQPPPAPVMSETFQGSGEVEFHGVDSTDFGTFVLARDHMNMKGLEKEDYSRGEGEMTEVLNRYDMNKTYFLRGSEKEPHCIEEDRKFNGYPKFWSFLDTAFYEGTTTVREIVYDIWGNNIGGVRYEFGRPQTNSSILYVYRRKTAESSTFYSFMKYSTTVDPSIFDIPSGCKPGK